MMEIANRITGFDVPNYEAKGEEPPCYNPSPLRENRITDREFHNVKPQVFHNFENDEKL
jgi:hypothetical protein